jgi:Holliday junction DNA helicase RuvA
MIALLSGLLRALDNQMTIIDVNGVGYEVMVTSRTASQLGPLGSPVTLHVITQVREDAITLFGFNVRDDKECFMRLTTVQGVGAKMALSMLSAFTPEQIWHAVVSDDKKTLTQADGVGPKLALRLTTELKEFASKQIFPGQFTASKNTKTQSLSSVSQNVAPQTPQNEAVSALVNLGYSPVDAVRAVTFVANQNQQADLASLITLALREISA